MEPRKPKVALKFCGCCNPQVNLSRLARYLQNIAEEHAVFQLLPLSLLPRESVEVVVLLCGCPRACVNREDVKARAQASVVVAGKSVDGEYVPEPGLTSAVEQKLMAVLKRIDCSDSEYS